jgi:hypothetical protein
MSSNQGGGGVSGGGSVGGGMGSSTPAPTAAPAPAPAPKAAPAPASNKPGTVAPAPSRALEADRQATRARGATYADSPRPADLPIATSPPSAMAKTDQAPAKAEPAKTDQAKPDQARPDQAKTEPAKTEPAKAEQAKADEAKSEQKSDKKNDPEKSEQKPDAPPQTRTREELERSAAERRANRQIPKEDLPSFKDRQKITDTANDVHEKYGVDKQKARREMLEQSVEAKRQEGNTESQSPAKPAASQPLAKTQEYKPVGRGRNYPHWPTAAQKDDIRESTQPPGFGDAIDKKRAINRYGNEDMAPAIRQLRENKIATETNRRRALAENTRLQSLPIAMEEGKPPSAGVHPKIKEIDALAAEVEAARVAKRAAASQTQAEPEKKRVTENDNPIKKSSAWLSKDRKKAIKAAVENWQIEYPEINVDKRQAYRDLINGARPLHTRDEAPELRPQKQASQPQPQPPSFASPDDVPRRLYPYSTTNPVPEPRPHERLDVAHKTFLPRSVIQMPRHSETWGQWVARHVAPEQAKRYQTAKIEAQDKSWSIIPRMFGLQDQVGFSSLGLPYRMRPSSVRDRVSVQRTTGGRKLVTPPKLVEDHELAWSRVADVDVNNCARGHRIRNTARLGKLPAPSEMPVVYSYAPPAHAKRYKPNPLLLANTRPSTRTKSIFEPLREELARQEQKTEPKPTNKRKTATQPRPQPPPLMEENNPLNDLFRDMEQEKNTKQAQQAQQSQQTQQSQQEQTKGGKPPAFGHAVLDESVTQEWLSHSESCKGENCPRCCKVANKAKGNWDSKSGIEPRSPKFKDEWAVQKNGSILPLTGNTTNTLRPKPEKQWRGL